MGKIASDGSEGSEGKEGGNDHMLLPNTLNYLATFNQIKENFMGSHSSSDGSEASEAKENSESSKFRFDQYDRNEGKAEISSEIQIKQGKVNKISLLVF